MGTFLQNFEQFVESPVSGDESLASKSSLQESNLFGKSKTDVDF